MTEPERLLWSRLRPLNREGIRIRRQAPIGDYIVDFACHTAKLVIELDGGGHYEPDQAAYDRRRDRWLEGRGYHVVRLWNGALYEDLDAVLDHVFQLLRERHRGGAGP